MPTQALQVGCQIMYIRLEYPHLCTHFAGKTSWAKLSMKSSKHQRSNERTYSFRQSTRELEFSACSETSRRFTSIGGQDRQQPIPYNPRSTVAEQVRSSFATSLKNLKTTYIDSYILHSPLDTIEKTLEAWKVLCSLQDEGVVKKIGVSNTYDVKILEMLEKIGGRGVQVVQNRWYEENRFDRDVKGISSTSECGVLGKELGDVKMTPPSRSFWTLTGSPSLLRGSDVAQLCEQKGVTPAQMVYRLVQHWGIVPLAGSTNEEHMKHGLEAEKIPLIEEEIPPGLKSIVWKDD
ncbi:hypothetical protein FRC17_005863 [Serendipita sp. 399]|nr:hypothetical protein FRC17_005863 [Serendipita sp. 399]